MPRSLFMQKNINEHNTISSDVTITSLTTANDVYVPIPIAASGGTARIKSITAVISGTLTTGNATLTAQINGVAVTGGLITFVLADTVAGTQIRVFPTALNTVDANDVLKIVVGGTNATARVANVVVVFDDI